MDADTMIQQQLQSTFRKVQPRNARQLQQQAQQQAQSRVQSHIVPRQTLATSSDLDLSALGDDEGVFDSLPLHGQSHQQVFQSANGFGSSPHVQPRRQLQGNATGSPHTPQQRGLGPQFGVLTPTPAQHSSIARVQQEDGAGLGSPESSDQRSNGHLSTTMVSNPPDLAEWRQKLFNVDEMITLSEEEYKTYFPHVDNVYSHRSTQKYKRKPFVSHYWDCRLKGRPPGTPKSDDPNKKKRRRTARERDLCDVKIKITEYFPGAMLRADFVPDDAQGESNDNDAADNGANYFTQDQSMQLEDQVQTFMTTNANGGANAHPGATGKRYYTIQRVNGNGGNGKGDGVAGPHKHTLEESDRVKKNSVQRWLINKTKEEKKTLKTYHKKANGPALNTVKRHSKDNDLKLFGGCFCPFVQRVWIALEAKGIPYQYIEVDPYKKPQALLDINPRGLIPAIRHGDWGCGESTVLMEYLEDLDNEVPLLPPNNPQLRATCRLWSDHINRKIVPAFYQLLQAQDISKQAENTQKLQAEIKKLVDAATTLSPDGPFFLGAEMSYVDIQFAPWMVRFNRVLKPYRAWPDPPPGSRWEKWLNAVEDNEHVKATTSNDDLYLDSYERYAQNRPGTSELADAINGGTGLP